MSATEDIKSGGVVSFSVKVAGAAVPDPTAIHAITIEQSVNRIPTAKITILDGDPSDSETQNFTASSSSTFVPGQEVAIEAGYDGVNAQIFKGIITQQTLRVDALIGSALEVECRDASVKMIVGRKSVTYSKKKDSDIISTLIGSYSGLESSVSATSATWPQQVQYNASDWDFMLTRAEANGMVVIPLNGKVTVAAPDADSSPVLEIAYGNNMLSFSGDMNAVSQLGNVKASAWDYKNQQIVTGQASNSNAGAGNITSKKLSEVVGLSDFDLGATAPLTSAELTEWSKAQMVKSTFSKIRADVTFQGSNLVFPGKYITLGGMGDRFDGDHLVSTVIQRIEDGNWVTEATLGMSPTWFSQEPDVTIPPAMGLLPGIRGLYNGTVKKMYEDPDSEYRIQVNIPLLDPAQQGDGLWARLSNFYSTSGAGAFFLPEVGDEVIVGFLNEDPRFPVILGSLYSSSKIKPYDDFSPADQNPKKGIVTKNKLRIIFDDEHKIITVQTPNKNQVVFSDQDEKITMTDQNSNSIEMSSSGITMKTPQNISITADQKVTIKGQMGVSIEAPGGDVKTSGMNIKESADMEFSAQGSMTAQVQGGTELTLKGAMVMIN